LPVFAAAALWRKRKSGNYVPLRAELSPVSEIHPAAFISPSAKIGKNVAIGPFCVIEGDAQIGDGCRLSSHVVVKAGTSLGPNNVVQERVVLGGDPQHLLARPPFGRVAIGAGNVFRECVTVHRAMKADQTTTIGDGNFLMINVHIAHDCVIGSHNIIANNTMFGGHITVGNHAYVSAAVAIHQFCRVGDYAMVGGQAHINKDIPPYVTLDGLTSRVVGLNVIGLKRKGFTPEDLAQLKAAYRVIYRSGLRWSEVLAVLAEQFSTGRAAAFAQFFAGGQRGFMPERRTPRVAAVKMPLEPALEEDAQPLRKVG
jgi:UDP-N-acetylglucosamine acyltransferase